MELLERASFLQALAEYAGEAEQGDGRLVLLSGESGIGKTALLEAFQQRSGGRWLWGACDGLLTPRPLGPLFDIGAQAGGELARLCHGGASRDQLFGAFLAEIDSPATLTVAVIEDVHWADEATLDLLRFLGRRLSRVRAMLLASYRDDELRDDHPLRMVLGDLATQRSTRRMRLPPLSGQAVRALVGQRDVDPAELHRVTGGNPFYVREIIEAGWPSIPPTVRDVVGARLARSTPAIRQALQAAAVIGTRMERRWLASVLADPDTLVDEGLATGILVADGATLQFRHELFRMTVAETIAPHRKTELHARLLAALEGAEDADPAVLAHHAEGAGDEKAVRRHAPEAARRSSALGAHREAAAQFERALRFADADDRPALAALHEAVRTSTRCSTAWTKPRWRCAPPCGTAASSATTCTWARIWACCTTSCASCAGEKKVRRPSRSPCECCSRCRPARSWRWPRSVWPTLCLPQDGTLRLSRASPRRWNWASGWAAMMWWARR